MADNQPFVQLDDAPSSFAPALQSLIQYAESEQRASLTLPPELAPEATIPLAALLLEYPVAYVPATDKTTFLSNVPLDIYECVLSFKNGQNMVPSRHTLLKFSCPSELAGEDPLHLGHSQITTHLTQKFSVRLQKVAPGTSIQVLCSSQILDRVAL